jgi:hypothetical protein
MARPFVEDKTVKEGLETPLPEKLRRFKVRAWARRGDGRRFRSGRVEVVHRSQVVYR